VRFEPFEQPEVDPHEGVVGVPFEELADVGSGHERARGGRVQHQDAALPGVVAEDLVEGLGGGEVDGIALLGPVEPDEQGIAPPLDDQRTTRIRHEWATYPSVASVRLLADRDQDRLARTARFTPGVPAASPGKGEPGQAVEIVGAVERTRHGLAPESEGRTGASIPLGRGVRHRADAVFGPVRSPYLRGEPVLTAANG